MKRTPNVNTTRFHNARAGKRRTTFYVFRAVKEGPRTSHIHCSTLPPHTATHCNTLQHAATHFFSHHILCDLCSKTGLVHSSTCTLCTVTAITATHYVATCCNTKHCVVTRCNTTQHTATHCNTLQHTATHCNTLQHNATQCNTLQRTLQHTLQHAATRCSIVFDTHRTIGGVRFQPYGPIQMTQRRTEF